VVKIDNVEMTVGDRANMITATMLTVEMQFIEPVIKRNNLLVNDEMMMMVMIKFIK